MNTPELHDNDTDDRKSDEHWPRLATATEDGPSEPCAVCGSGVPVMPLMFRAHGGALCDACARRLVPHLFDLARQVIHMADDDWDRTHDALLALLDYTEDRALW